MPKQYRRRRSNRRRRSYRKRGSKLNPVQRKLMSYKYMRYTKVEDVLLSNGSGFASAVISGIAGKNSTTPAATFTLASCENDGNITADMALYQQFCILGYSYKLMFPPAPVVTAQNQQNVGRYATPF